MVYARSDSPSQTTHSSWAGDLTPVQRARQLAEGFAATSVERDRVGGTPKTERDQLRESGLLGLLVPTQLGGLGASWREILAVTREIARVDSSLAHVFGFQHLLLATLRLFSREDQWQPWFEQTVRERWFWGNALNPLDKRTQAIPQGHEYRFNGHKSFCSGAIDSDMLIASAVEPAHGDRLLIAAIPTRRDGISLADDWNNIGQRQTDSGSARFDSVRVERHELLLDPGPLSTPFASLRPLIAQLLFANLFVGVAEGAFEEARRFTREQARPWFKSPASQASEDPYVLRHYGELYAQLEAARVLVERAADQLDEAWLRGEALQAGERAELAVAIGAAKVIASRHGLDATSRIFEVCGARATHAALGLDRFWRNLRTQTLHDPLDYRLHELGDWSLNQRPPTPSFYS